MRLVLKPDSLLDWIALRANLAPTPILETQIALISARAIMAATELRLFSRLESGALSAAEIAEACGLDLRATEALLPALVSTGYLRYSAQRYRLTAKSRKWLAPQNRWSLFDYMPHVRDVWRVTEGLERFLQTGRALDIHESNFGAEQWRRYQRAMRSLASVAADEVGRRLPVKPGAKLMLDIGGSHGYYSVALCRKHPGLSAVILDLREAIEESAPILAQENMQDCVQHRAGNALTDDLGENIYDLILISNLAHHFSDAQNRDLAKRAARALKPGGTLVIQEMIRPHSPASGDQVSQVLNLFFALTSTSGTWSIAEIESWLREAKLKVGRPIFLRSVPGAAQVSGILNQSF
ncbi:MAG TPA: class I SAM-dependent methyltransferase [Bryobacteraceae bacterium]|jgi:SAM-dependent methyltransferase